MDLSAHDFELGTSKSPFRSAGDVRKPDPTKVRLHCVAGIAHDVWLVVTLLIATGLPSRAQKAAELTALDDGAAYNLAANRITDPDPRLRAWAAELIAGRRFEALYPGLLTALAVSRSSTPGQFHGTPDDLALEVIADAVIRAGLPVLAADGRKLYPEFPAQAMILLSRAADDNRSALVSVFQETKVGEIWLAAADLLARNPSPQFVLLQLDEFRVFTRFLVSEPGAGMGASYGDCSDPAWVEASMHVLKTPEDWPPVAVYRLTMRNGDAVIAHGVNSVSFIRQVTEDPRPWKGFECGRPEVQELRRDLILQLAGADRSTTTLRAVNLRDITRVSDDQYRRAAIAILEEQARSFATVVSQLQSKGLITPAQAAERRLHMRVVILGTESGGSLPDLPDLGLLGIAGEYKPY
jgi:hypothetical protein